MNSYFDSKLTTLTLAIAGVLTGCGGGGSSGGGGSNDTYTGYLRSGVSYHTPIRVGTYDPLVGSGYYVPVDDIFVRDLNSNGIDEVIFGGRMTPAPNASDWKSYQMQIYGWNQGAFNNETARWFSGNDNRIIGTEPAVRFGDFDGDMHVDMLVSPGTDTASVAAGPVVLFKNNGSGSFVRNDIDIGNVWSHDATVTDFDRDGIDDFFVLDYNGRPALALGSASGNLQVLQSINGISGSGVSAADYLGDGTVSVIVSDASGNANQDTKLYIWSQGTNNELLFTEIAALPASRFYLPKWDAVRAQSSWEPHEIRNMTMDFDNDGLSDVIVFSVMSADGSDDNYSEVQFLRNNGNGSFNDVTDNILVNYDTTRQTSYNPVIFDINGDGLNDIVLSGADHNDRGSTSVLLQTSDGKFVDSFADVFSDFTGQIRSAESAISGKIDLSREQIGIVRGPGSKLYLVSNVNFNDNGGDLRSAVYLAEIGTQGTITPINTVAALEQAWPWMSSVEINETLARTSPMSINGMTVIDPYAALSPVGSLKIALEGRQGSVRPINGYIAGVELRSQDMVLSAVDDLKRDFQVDLSPMNVSRFDHWTRTDIQREDFSAPSFSHARSLVDTHVWEVQGFSMAQNAYNQNMFTIGTPGIKITDNFSLHSQLTSLNFSPWVQMSGAWGEIESTLITEFAGSYRKNSFVFNTGIMYAKTEIDPGLVRNINDIVSVWTELGYQDRASGLSAFVGIKPWALTGSVDIRMPTGIDQNGNMQYRNMSAPIQNDLESYLRIGYTKKVSRQLSASVGGIIFANGVHGVMGSVRIAF